MSGKYDETEAGLNLTQDELRAVEQELLTLLPAPSRIERDPLMFELGRLSTRPARREWAYRAWQSVAVGFGLLSMTLGGSLFHQQRSPSPVDVAQFASPSANGASLLSPLSPAPDDPPAMRPPHATSHVVRRADDLWDLEVLVSSDSLRATTAHTRPAEIEWFVRLVPPASPADDRTEVLTAGDRLSLPQDLSDLPEGSLTTPL